MTETTDYFLADTPIESAKQDRLGRAHFAKSLAKILKKHPNGHSLVIGLCGDWGSGKTSVKNMATEALNATEGKPYIVEFNPWRWPTSEEISRAFFREIFFALGKSDPSSKGKERARRWRRYGRLILGLSEAIESLSKNVPAILGAAAAIFGITAVWRFLENQSDLAALGTFVAFAVLAWIFLRFGGRLIEGIAIGLSVAEPNEAVEAARKSLQDALRESRPILVIIDDIDRLNEDDVRLVFRHLKINGDFPNLIYLLLFQRDRVERCLTANKLLLPSDKEGVPQSLDGRAYLEKLVQVIFDLPQVERRKIEVVLFDGLDQVLDGLTNADNFFDERRWGNLLVQGLRPYFRNLRDVNRFLAPFSAHVEMFRGERAFEVNPIDLIGIEVLRIFEPDFYSALASGRDLLVGERITSNQDTAAKEAILSLPRRANETRREAAKTIFRQLFPNVDWAFPHGMGYHSSFQSQWTLERRICSPKFFDRYFLLGFAEQDVSESELLALIDAAADREKFVTLTEALERRGLLGAFLDRLDDYKQKIPIRVANQFVSAIFDIGDTLDMFGGGLALSSHTHAWRIVYWYLLQEEDTEARSRIVLDAMRASQGLSIPASLISLDEGIAKNKRQESTPLFTEAGLENAKVRWVEKIRAIASEPERLLHNKQLGWLLYRWRDWGGQQEVREWAGAASSTDAGVISVIKAFVRPVENMRSGDAVSTTRWTLKLSELDEFASTDGWGARLSTLSLDSLDDDAKRVVETFLRALKRRKEGKQETDLDFDGD